MKPLSDRDPHLKVLAKAIRKARIDMDWEQEQLADQLHLSKKTISAWERARNQPGYLTLIQLAAVLQKPISYFFEPPAFQSDVGTREDSGAPPGTIKKATRAKRKAA